MATGATTTWNIPLFGDSDFVTPIQTPLNAQSNALDTALTNSQKALVPRVADQTARDALFPSPLQGNAVFRKDKGWEETYYELYNASTNPGGQPIPGWRPTGGALPFIRVGRTAASNTSSSPSVYLPVSWDNEVANPLGTAMHSNTVNPTRLIAPVPGYYRVQGQARISNTAGSGNVILAKNGTQIIDTLQSITPVAGTTPFPMTEDIMFLNTGDYVEVLFAANQVNIPITGARATMTYVRP